MGFTKNQQLAISKRGENILVSAAAGSGKTTVLAERIATKVIEDKVNIDNLLVVTFTKDAANEMKERIIKRINKALKEDSENVFLLEQLVRINKAQISTIDAFCLKVVKRHFKELDIEPNFKIGSKSELDILKSETLESFLDIYYEKNDEDFIKVVDSFTKNAKDDNFKNIFLQIYEKSQNLPNPKNWLTLAYKQFEFSTPCEFFKTPSFQKLISYIRDFLEEAKKLYSKIEYLTTGILNFKKFEEKSLEQFLLNEMYYIDDMIKYIDNENYDALLSSLYNIKYERWKPNFLKEYPYLKESVKLLRDTSKNLIKEKIVKKFFYMSINDIIQNNKTIYPILRKMCELIIHFDEFYMSEKKRKNMYTFSDISHFCLNILCDDDKPSKIAKEYIDFFDEIIIDEYQDSNSVQEKILSIISKNNRFMVGDIKQCIYRFRQANTKIFNEKYTGYFDKTLNGTRIDLNENFRSDTPVINAINLIFENIMSSKLGEVCYDENAKLYNKAYFPKDDSEKIKCSLNIINCENIANTNENSEELDEIIEIAKDEMEAQFICQKINELFNTGYEIYDKDINSYRKIEYKDIVILMRTKSNFDVFSQKLLQNGIPVYTDASEGFYDFTEIKTILNILNILVNPLQDYHLVGTMYSPIFNFSANELLEIKINYPDEFFYNCIFKFIENTKNILLKQKCENFLSTLSNWKNASKTMSVSELLNYIYEDSTYYNYLQFLSDKDIRQANLNMLLDKAMDFEENNSYSLFNFINYINKFKTIGDESKASILSKDENVVKIMTVHRSKGLEFPVVFLCNLSKKFNISENKNAIVFDEQLMIGLDIFSYNKKIDARNKISSIQKDIILYKNKEESYSEEMRILYVALTRAKQTLILVGSINKNFNDELTNMENVIIPPKKILLPRTFLENGKSSYFLTWVYTAIKNFDVNNFWDINIIKHFDLLNFVENNFVENEVEKENNHKLFFEFASLDKNKKYSPFKQKIYDTLNFEYENKFEQNISSNLSVSEIKRVYQTKILDTFKLYDENFLNFPSFYTLNSEKLENVHIGTVYHKILENIDFSINSIEQINVFLDKLISLNILTENEISQINKNVILTFLNSDLANKIKNAKIVEREKVFSIKIKANKIYNDDELINSNSTIIVNGIIDLYFETEEGLFLVDYKTDKSINDDYFINKYKIQLDIYKEALESATNKKVKKCIIYSVLQNKEIILS